MITSKDKKIASLQMDIWKQKEKALKRDLYLCEIIESTRNTLEDTKQELKHIQDVIHKVNTIQSLILKLSGTQALRKKELERRKEIAHQNVKKYHELKLK